MYIFGLITRFGDTQKKKQYLKSTLKKKGNQTQKQNRATNQEINDKYTKKQCRQMQTVYSDTMHIDAHVSNYIVRTLLQHHISRMLANKVDYPLSNDLIYLTLVQRAAIIHPESQGMFDSTTTINLESSFKSPIYVCMNICNILKIPV